MVLRAIAFHGAIAGEKLEELYRSEYNQLFSGTTGANCPKCGRHFAIFLVNSDDSANATYLEELEKRISEDCDQGNHKAEYALNTIP